MPLYLKELEINGKYSDLMFALIKKTSTKELLEIIISEIKQE